MKIKLRLLATTVMLAAFATPALADFWIVQDTTTKRCTIVEQKPTGQTMIIVGGDAKVYRTREDAQRDLTTIAACTSSAQATQVGPAAQILTTLPANAMTVTHWYKQNVYDPSDAKIGEIMDVLVDKDGKALALIVGVGGFLGIGEKDVAVPFNAIQFKTKDNNKWYPVMNATKDALKNAPGYKYDRTAMTWVPDNSKSDANPRAPNPAPR